MSRSEHRQGIDPDEYRARTAEAWEGAAAGWGRQRERMQSAAQAVSMWMVDAVAPQPGERVLELAAGPGDTGFLAAELIAPGGGTLICSDRAEAMLEVAKARATGLGLRNVEFRTLDLEWIDLETASVDAVLCRWAFMLVPDPEAALRETRRVLKPGGGRIALAVWDDGARNPWATLLQEEAVAKGLASASPPGAPGMFALAPAERLADVLGDAGFAEVRVEAVDFANRFASVEEWLAQQMDCSPSMAPLWASLDERSRTAFADGLRARASEHAAPDGSLTLPARSLVARASA